jgi:hypothetical protein
MPMCTTPPGVAVLDRDHPDAGDFGRLVLPCDGRCQKREDEQGRSGMTVRKSNYTDQGQRLSLRSMRPANCDLPHDQFGRVNNAIRTGVILASNDVTAIIDVGGNDPGCGWIRWR